MKPTQGSRPVLGFYWHGQSIWRNQPIGEGVIDSISVGVYYFDETGRSCGTDGEFSFRWTILDKEAVAELRIYHDGWGVLLEHQDALMGALELIKHKNPSPDETVNALKCAGLIDLTPRSPQEANHPATLPFPWNPS